MFYCTWFFKRLYIQYTAQKMKFSIKDFFSKCDQIRRKLHFLCSVCSADILVNFLCVRNTNHIRLRIILVLTFEMFSEALKFIDFWGKHLNKIVIFHQNGLRGQVMLKMVYLCTLYPLDELWMRLIIKMQHFQFGVESCKCEFFLNLCGIWIAFDNGV